VKDGFLVTPLTCFLPLIGDAGALHRALSQDPGQWLPDSRHLGEDRWTMDLHGVGMTRTVATTVGRAWWAGTTQWRALSWEPLGDPDDPEKVAKLLPSLDGELGLHTSGDSVSLVLDARYRPPGGALGAALDAIMREDGFGPTGNMLLIFNMERGIMSDVTMRRVVQSVVNAEEIMTAASGRGAPAMTGPEPTGASSNRIGVAKRDAPELSSDRCR
jgi:hypothetical protein